MFNTAALNTIAYNSTPTTDGSVVAPPSTTPTQDYAVKVEGITMIIDLGVGDDE